MSENKVISKFEFRFQVHSKAKQFACGKVPDRPANGLLRRKRLSGRKVPNVHAGSYGKSVQNELIKEAGSSGCVWSQAPASDPQSEAFKLIADFSENINSTSTYEESNATGALELQAENESAYPFLIEICKKEKSEQSLDDQNAKESESKWCVLVTETEDKRVTADKKKTKNFLINKQQSFRKEKICKVAKSRKNITAVAQKEQSDLNMIIDEEYKKGFEQLNNSNNYSNPGDNCETDSKSDSIHNFDIYLPEEGESLENDFAAGNKQSFEFEGFLKKNSQENLIEVTEANLLFKEHYEKEVFGCSDNLINNKHGTGESSFPIAPCPPVAVENKNNKEKEGFPEGAKRAKARKKRENGVDELMQDSFLRCFFIAEGKEEKKKKAKSNLAIGNNNIQEEVKAEKNETEIFSFQEEKKNERINEDIAAESRNAKLTHQCSLVDDQSHIINKGANKEEGFLPCPSASGFSNEYVEIKESILVIKDLEKIDKFTNSNFKNVTCVIKKNNRKKIAAPAARLIKEHCSHRFMFKHFPREYRKETFSIRYQKQQNRRKLLKDKIFISPSDIKLGLICSVNLERKTNYDLCFTQDEATPDLELNEDLKPKKIWDPEVLKENLISDYLFNIERKWPLDIYHFSQDAALDFLMLMKFNIAKAVKYIQYTNRRFKSFMKDRDLKIKKSQRGKEDLDSWN